MTSKELMGLALLIFLTFPGYAFAYGGNGGSGDSSGSYDISAETTGVSFIGEGSFEPGSYSNVTLYRAPLRMRRSEPGFFSDDEWTDFEIKLGKAELWTLETVDSLSFIGFIKGGVAAKISFPVTIIVSGVYHTTKNFVRILFYGTERNIELNERSPGGRYVNYYILNRSDTRRRSNWTLELEKNQVIHYKYEDYMPRKKVSP